ncbi:ADP-ribose pyrophosphatase [Actinokineospora alba]|uniref:ADP-ribose pyrophosphatase n=1 Tax=Actinokineospora alba TaxID=504798 RepID=A0A1H0QL02_9PSEU|nr:NUDIX hydrolase [Actinokineospora alba]TDP70522.1 ADP-ribose pyrophosphatase [Actinokineospora alba]SDI29408.1 ADP-ribose pyrophosphatase [Actinokineospora alba]SDP17429.1 ADP-ribose pyrophosphatase [Actinokineospora alba]
MTDRHEFSVASTRDIHIGRILALRIDEVRMPGGNTASREVVEHLGAVAVVALDDDGTLVLVDQYRHPVGRRLWELPAGLIDAGEDPLVAAKRELVEEVGVVASDWSVLVDMAVSPGFTDEAIRVYLATGLSTVDHEVLGDEEADMVADRVPLEQAVRMVLSGEIVNAAAVGGVLAAFAVDSGAAAPRVPDAPWTDEPTRFAQRS